MRKILLWILESILITLAFTTQFHPSLVAADYGESIDFLLAQVAELLGEYQLQALLLLVIVAISLKWMKQKEMKGYYDGWILPLVFSAFLLIGNSFYAVNSFDYCFGSLVNFLKFITCFAGYTLLFRRLLQLLYWAIEFLPGLEKIELISDKLMGKHCFGKVFLFLLVLWTPVLLISYPGNLCYDVIGQIEQVMGTAVYSAHHPLFSSLIIGGIVKLGTTLFGSSDAGLMLYIVFQTVLLASALAATIAWMKKRKIASIWIFVVLSIYTFAPMYSNIVSTAVKDVPFVALVIWYMIYLATLLEDRNCLKKAGFTIPFLLIQVLVMLLRNNGVYVVLISGLVLSIIWWKQSKKKERIRLLLVLVFIPFVIWKLVTGIMMTSLQAQEGSTGEMLSLPFQQTARYMQLYRQELSEDEKAAIEAVLGDVEEIAAHYNPDIADPVKALYKKDATKTELLSYLTTWAGGFFKHPVVYVEAFTAHVYGWFDPMVPNEIRYEVEYDAMGNKEIFTGAHKVMVFFYRLANRISILGFLENVGVYTWGIFVLVEYTWKRRRSHFGLLIPLLVSLLICMASPCFFLHPRYAYPIMFTLPFVFGILINKGKLQEENA